MSVDKPQPETRPKRQPRAPIFGIFLLFLGVVLLLQNLNVLPWQLWEVLWRFWPVLIIAIGLSILLRGRNAWLATILVLALFGACLGIAVWQYEPSSWADEAPTTYSEPLGDLDSAEIALDFTAGSLTVSSLPSGSRNLVEVKSEVAYGDGDVRADLHRSGSQGSLRLIGEGKVNSRWEVRVTRNIPITMGINAALSSLELDLSDLELTELRADIDVANCTVKLPSSAGSIYAYIKADVANLEVTIPDEVAAKVKADVDLGVFEVDENRFPLKGSYYTSRGFSSAENRVELEIDCDIGRVQVK